MSAQPALSPATVLDAPLDASRLLAPIAADMKALDDVIRSRLDSDVALVRTVSDYIIGAGGKRLRPAVLTLVARALGKHGGAVHALAAVIEFIHTATLLHDDVVDESDMRRGRPTSNAMFGNAASVLVGDFLYSRSFQMMVVAGSMQVMRILADATNRIAEGEVLQLLSVHDPTVDEARYLRVVESKTATLFDAAARIGAVVAGADPQTEDRCAEYGRRLGTAFQIIDDVLDYSGHVEEIGKRLGDDLREGKVTLPIIHALGTASSRQRQFIEAAIRDGGGDFSKVAQIVQDIGSLSYSRQRAEAEADRARTAVTGLAPSAFRDCLLDLAELAIRRDR